jgi:hypothetical protein
LGAVAFGQFGQRAAEAVSREDKRFSGDDGSGDADAFVGPACESRI